MLDNEVVKNAVDGKYTEFSDAVKKELKTKMSNHEVSKKHVSNFDKIQNMKDIFKQISTLGKEEENPEPVKEPEPAKEEE